MFEVAQVWANRASAGKAAGDCNTTQVTISQITDEYIATRGAGQAAASLTLYRKTKWNLIDVSATSTCLLYTSDAADE